MGVLNHIALWGLSLLLIPLIIHFLSKKDQKPIQMGSIMFLTPAESQSSRSINFTQWFLFMMRCLIIIILIMIISDFYFSDRESIKSIYLEDSVISRLNESKDLTYLTDSEHQVFTINGVDNPPGSFKNYWTLIQYINGQQDSSIVFSENMLKGFSGNPILLDKRHQWRPIPQQSLTQSKDTVNDDENSFEITWNHLEELTTYSIDQITTQRSPDTVFFRLIASQSSMDMLESFQKIILAMDQQIPIKLAISDKADADWVILSDTVIEMNSNFVIRHQNSESDLRFMNEYPGYFTLTGHLSLDNLVASDFIDQWSQEITYRYLEMEKKDKRTITSQPRYADLKEETDDHIEARIKPVGTPLWLLLFLFILLERIIFHKQNA